jgi:hypothetical protein
MLGSPVLVAEEGPPEQSGEESPFPLRSGSGSSRLSLFLPAKGGDDGIVRLAARAGSAVHAQVAAVRALDKLEELRRHHGLACRLPFED